LRVPGVAIWVEILVARHECVHTAVVWHMQDCLSKSNLTSCLTFVTDQLKGLSGKRIISQTEGGLMRAPKPWPCDGWDGGGHPVACTHDPLPGYCRLLQKLGSGNEARWHCSALQHRVDLEVSASAWWGSAHPGAAEGPFQMQD